MMKFLNSPKVYRWLLLFNALVVLCMFYLSMGIEFPDANSYWHMAKGFRHGVFSSWYFLPVYSPETLRMWGYPFFVYLCQLIYEAPITVMLIQLLMHFGALFLCLKLIHFFDERIIYRNIFLLLLLPNLQISYYAGQMAAETPNIFFIVLFFYIWFIVKEKWPKYVWLALIGFIIMQLRPAFLLMPFCIVAYKLFFDRSHLKYVFGFLAFFIISLVPFGIWSKKAHGIFKITPLEGGAGAAHNGYWSFRLPEGYHTQFYWDNLFTRDITQPNFTTAAEKEQGRLEYEKEWNEINKKLQPYITKEDSFRLNIYRQKKIRLWEIMSSQYTDQREKLLKEYLINDIKAHPVYYIKTRLFTFCRLWYTGLNKQQFEAASFKGKIKLLYPFLATFIFIFCGLWLVIFSVVKKWLPLKKFWPLLVVILYYGIMHVPFGIQARYTIPVHLFILLLLAVAIGNKFVGQKKKISSQHLI